MSLTLAQIQALANQAAEVAAVDMSETGTGGFNQEPLPAGWYLGRFKGYIELGKHSVEFKGKPKPPVLQARLEFELYHDGDVYNINTFGISIGNNEKAKAKQAFDRMNYKQTAKHFAQLLGSAYMFEVTLDEKDGKKYNNINFATINPPIELVTKQPYQLPPDDESTYRLFLWDLPTKEGWDALYIDGTNDAGKSKNFLQNKIISATDFVGSPLEQLLGGVALPDPAAGAGIAVPEVTAPVADVPFNPEPAVEHVTPAVTTPVVAPVVTAPVVTPTVTPVVTPAIAVPAIPVPTV